LPNSKFQNGFSLWPKLCPKLFEFSNSMGWIWKVWKSQNIWQMHSIVWRVSINLCNCIICKDYTILILILNDYILHHILILIHHTIPTLYIIQQHSPLSHPKKRKFNVTQYGKNDSHTIPFAKVIPYWISPYRIGRCVFNTVYLK